MRVNVYGEELTNRIEIITKEVHEPLPQGLGIKETHVFYGLRLWLKFPNQPWWIHRKADGEEDDDSSAVTIWFPNKIAMEAFADDIWSLVTDYLVEQKRVKELDND